MENVRKHKDTKLRTSEAKRNYLVSEPNYYTTIFFSKFIHHRNKKNHNYSLINQSIRVYQYWK